MCTFCYFRSEKSERVRTGVVEVGNGVAMVQVNDFPRGMSQRGVVRLGSLCASIISMRGSTSVFCCYFSFRKMWKSASGCGRGYEWSRYESSKLPSSLVLCCTL